MVWIAAIVDLFVLQVLGLRVVLLLHVLELLGLFLVELLHFLRIGIRLALDLLLLLHLFLFELLAFGVLLQAQFFELLLLLLLVLRIRGSGRTRVWRTVVVATICGRVRWRLILRRNTGRRLIRARSVGIRGVVDGLTRTRRVVVDRRLACLDWATGGVGRFRLNRRDGASNGGDAHVASRSGGRARSGLWRHLVILRDGERTAAVCTDSGLLALDRNRRWRRRSLGHDGAGRESRRRANCGRTACADEGLARRSDGGSASGDASVHDVALVDTNDVA